MSSKIILLNGPKACGKNVAVDHIKLLTHNVVRDRRTKDHLFLATATLFKMSLPEFFTHYTCRDTKETPKTEFAICAAEFNKLAPIIKEEAYMFPPTFCEGELAKLSVREALIYVSEIVCKPAFGRDYFGTARADSIGYNEWAIDDSCGFDDELPPTIEKLGMDNVMLIRIHGRGSFEGDSRSYINDEVVTNTIDVYNTRTEEEFLEEVGKIALDFYVE